MEVQRTGIFRCAAPPAFLVHCATNILGALPLSKTTFFQQVNVYGFKKKYSDYTVKKAKVKVLLTYDFIKGEECTEVLIVEITAEEIYQIK